MSTEHVGYLDYDCRMYRLTRARCVFVNNQLDVEASGAKARIKLYGIPFPNVDNVTELVGNSFVPDSDQIHSDPIAEGGVELRDGYRSWLSLTVRCTNHNPEKNTLSVHFQAEVEDPEWGNTDTVDGMAVCEIREKLW